MENYSWCERHDQLWEDFDCLIDSYFGESSRKGDLTRFFTEAASPTFFDREGALKLINDSLLCEQLWENIDSSVEEYLDENDMDCTVEEHLNKHGVVKNDPELVKALFDVVSKNFPTPTN